MRKTRRAGLLALAFAVSYGDAHADGYAVHVSSVKSAPGAEAEKERFEAAGYPSVVRREEIAGKGVWHRVYLGPYSEGEEARRIASEVRRTELTDYASAVRWTGLESAPGRAPKFAPSPETAPAPAEPGAESASRAQPPSFKGSEAAARADLSIPRRVEKPSVERWRATISSAREADREMGEAVLEVYPTPGVGRTILFARFSEPISGAIRGIIERPRGNPIAELEGTVRSGSTLLVWNTGESEVDPEPGAYEITLQTGETVLDARFVIPE